MLINANFKAYAGMPKKQPQQAESVSFKQTVGFIGDIEKLKRAVDHFSTLLKEGTIDLKQEIKKFNAENKCLFVRNNEHNHLLEVNFADREMVPRPSAILNYATYEVTVKFLGETIDNSKIDLNNALYA